MSPLAVVAVAKQWGRVNLWLLRHVCGLGVEWRGLEKIPSGGLIVASKHQSTWETFALLTVLEAPVYVLKRELMWIPVFGWCMRKARMIPVDRAAGRAALTAMTARARAVLGDGRQIIIFPEGTRRPAGAAPKYKVGVAFLYQDCAAVCVPIALNSGLYWPRRRFLRFPGKVRVEVLDPIPPGRDRNAFFTELEEKLEAATARLVGEGLRELDAAGRAHFETAKSGA
ncbi:MAG: 1-acyl-sn-glycerol-3-phosphate acyltransferase [Xanthobacteraceae bacterium]|nr:1-acyl-sn-glycerol-3-phosphate acyltransferase [Xanthobacteraceae bacterium]